MNSPASIMDLGPTLCAWAGVSQLLKQDGENLLPVITGETKEDADRIVVSEMMEKLENQRRYGLMLRKGTHKYMVYSGFEDRDILFDLEKDPKETVNAAGSCPEAAKEFRSYAEQHFDFAAIEEEQENRAQAARWMAAWERETGVDDSERWSQNTAKEFPVIRA